MHSVTIYAETSTTRIEAEEPTVGLDDAIRIAQQIAAGQSVTIAIDRPGARSHILHLTAAELDRWEI